MVLHWICIPGQYSGNFKAMVQMIAENKLFFFFAFSTFSSLSWPTFPGVLSSQSIHPKINNFHSSLKTTKYTLNESGKQIVVELSFLAVRLILVQQPNEKLALAKLTAIYAAHPALRVLALESTNLPLIPKSQSFTLPRSSSRILEGFTSGW